VVSDVRIDGGRQLRHAGEHPAAQPLGGEVAEEALDPVQPRRRGGCEVHVETRMLGQPLLHDGMFVRGVVVGDQMQRLVLGRLALDLAQELEPLGMTVALLALGDDLAIQHVERGKQRGRAVPLVPQGLMFPRLFMFVVRVVYQAPVWRHRSMLGNAGHTIV